MRERTRTPLTRLLQKALIVAMVVVGAGMLGTFGPGLLGAWWTKAALALVVVAGLTALLATR